MDNQQIKNTVVGYISLSTKYSAEQIKDNFILKNWPLALDNYSLAFIAMSCDKYVKSIGPDKSVFVRELQKKGLTVKGLIDLVTAKAEKQVDVVVN